ncbi:DNA polymerase III subunit gamma/tau [Undibacterium seohonense]|uniref:DNA polymerase III subunit gamma/tau n=1 Tax=Undibacterium seohonense TaxID=1344950 RepID=A0ABR6WZ02_9BURK|nr:DNA polymerase III subunit gamma/tau [Undibacterium seohonense]MBC3805908.1 DNA polymerase III subunit gamma/tau [Undibacterium seohonense]
MSYQVLARKYRPKSFETLVGQEHVVRALSHALDQQRLHHAYLFTGTRGVGKTTLSRILAKSFNCEKGITAKPCGVCDACTSIDAGRFVDYIEMDAASNRGVDEMASLLEQAIYAPSNARFKVYMIDEVHMLTNHAFNSMLKTLEEPPEHVKFILATTDPQKIPVTVLSRCLQFNLKQMPPGHIVGHLENILGQEHIDFEVSALRLLAQGAHGSMRDALSLTDQAIAYAAGKVSLDAVQSMLGALDQSYLIRLLDALVDEDGAALLAVADEMSARSLSYKAALQDLGSMLHQIAIAQMVPSALAEDLPERSELLRLAQSFNKEDVQLYYQIVVHGRNEIGLAPDEYAGFSMTLLRMLAFRPASVASSSSGGGGGGISRRSSTNLAPNMLTSTVATPGPAIAQRVSQECLQSPVNAPAVVQPLQSMSPELSAPALVVAPVATPLTSVAPASKPISPAMAALAAARAASGKKVGNPTAAASASTSNVMPAASIDTVRAEVSTESRNVGIAPLVSVPESTPRATTIAHSSHADKMPIPTSDSNMPPPWDDFESQAFEVQASQPHIGRHKEMQETDYWNEDSSDELPMETSPAPVDVGLNVPGLVVTAPAMEKMPSMADDQESQILASQDNLASEAVSSNIATATMEVMPSPIAKLLQSMPMAEINWDGHWPNLAASLPVRGVAQQLAQQSELRHCAVNGNAIQFKLCVPLQTLLSAGSGEKLSAALNERFAEFGREIRIDFEIGAVEQTANAQAVAERAERQVQAEQAIQSDGFVQTLMREFGASILTGSIRPI